MKTVHNQTQGHSSSRFYKPDRHYVMAESRHSQWDGNGVDLLLDTVDPSTGELAYVLEANGSNVEGRKITGDRRMVLLSCSKEYADRVAKERSMHSKERATKIEPQRPNEEESFGPDKSGGIAFSAPANNRADPATT